MSAPNSPPPQPNFNAIMGKLYNISLSASDLAEQFSHFNDVLASNHGAQRVTDVRRSKHGAQRVSDVRTMTSKINNLKIEVAQIRTQIRRMVTGIENIRAEVRDLRNEIKLHSEASEYNSLARLKNRSLALEADSQLSALRTCRNEDVENFPPTLGSIDNLDSAELNTLLLLYGLSTEGPLEDRQRLFKVFIGIIGV